MINPGRMAAIRSDVPGAPLYNSRKVGYHITGHRYSIVTLDEDVYDEIMSHHHNPDVVTIIFEPSGGGPLPSGGVPLYDFSGKGERSITAVQNSSELNCNQ